MSIWYLKTLGSVILFSFSVTFFTIENGDWVTDMIGSTFAAGFVWLVRS